MRDLRDLQHYWQEQSAHNPAQELVLCTIVGKTGSGYRTLGAKKIIRRDGEARGFLSGGCLEGDIVATALSRWDDLPFRQSFSTLSEEDRLMGYQTGCAGVIDILFEKLPADPERLHEYLPYGPDRGVAAVAIALDDAQLGKRTVLTEGAAAENEVFLDPWVQPVSLYVVGCGPNARPFGELAPSLGWEVTFLDYRQGNVITERPGVRSKILPVTELGQAIPEGARTAAVIMTHNYEVDLAVVGQLNNKTLGYLGCVGPRKRFEQIESDLQKFQSLTLDRDWASRVHAPAGLKQGHTPEDIAFSIVAQIQFGIAA